MLSFNDFLEGAHSILAGHILARRSGEHFSHEERLGEELLEFACAVHRLLVFVREFLDTQDCDDVLEVLVALENLLHLVSNIVMLLTDDFWREAV